MKQINLTIYVFIVTLLGGIALLRATSFLTSLRKKRLRWLKRNDRLEPFVYESSPFGEAEIEAKRHAQSKAAIESQFSVSRKLTVPFIIIMVMIALSIPFLPNIPATALSALFAIFTLFLGVVIRPFLENAVSGLILSSSKLIRIGDTVEVDGFYGTIEDISPTHTTVKNWDWRRIVKPNSQMLNDKIINHSLQSGIQWAHVDFYLQLDCNIDHFETALLESVRQSKYRLEETEVDFWMMELDHYSARCRIAAWAQNPSEAFYLKEEMNRAVSKLMFSLGVAPPRV